MSAAKVISASRVKNLDVKKKKKMKMLAWILH